MAQAAREGAAAVAAFDLRLFVPVQPMLASPGEDIDSTLEDLGEVSLEYKLDGARVQIHKDGEQVKVYSRRLNEVTKAVPEVVEATLALPVRDAVLDGETLALRDDGSPHPFQVTMRRFGRRLDVEQMRGKLPLSVRVFDVLRADGTTLIDATTQARWETLEAMAVRQIHRAATG